MEDQECVVCMNKDSNELVTVEYLDNEGIIRQNPLCDEHQAMVDGARTSRAVPRG